MDEAKAAAYYDELSRKGSGAARFKQGLGFSSSSSSDPPRAGEGLPSPSSFYSSFVRASGNPPEPSEQERRARLESVKDKLRKKGRSPSPDPRGRDRDRRRRSRSRDGKRSRSRERSGRRRSRDGKRSRSRSREREREGRGARGGGRRSRSPRRARDGGGKVAVVPDYSRLIDGYSQMSPAERVKAKMKLQLKETAEKDATKGSNSKWERFDFDKDAPLDDEEVDVAEDDASLVKDIGQTFRFSAVQAKREDEIKAAHDLAMFGAPAAPLLHEEEPVDDNENIQNNMNQVKSTLISDNLVSVTQKGSWRDRVRRPQESSKS